MLRLSVWRGSGAHMKRLRNVGTNLCASRAQVHNQSKPVIAIRREDNVVWERRAPLAPSHVRKLVQDGFRVIVQPANKRAFPVQEYISSGAEVDENLNEASVILGVKQVPIDSLLPNKTYVFFSHTIKAQAENMAMLDAILEKNIRLIDYEKMEQANGLRVVAFGRYAGYAGMINILHGMGLRLLAIGHHTPFMHIGIAHNYRTSSQAFQAVRDAGYEISLGRMPESIGPLTFVFTGTGNVSQGAQEVFRELPYVYVEPHELKNVAQHGDPSVVYGCVVDLHHHLRRMSDGGFDMHEYFDKPQLYESVFAKEIAPYASCIINGIFWRPNDPRLLTTVDAENLQEPIHSPKISPLVRRSSLNSPGCPRLPHRLIAIGDVSADPGGSLEFMTDCTSIDAPFDMYDATKVETKHGQGQVHQSTVKGPGILICSVDNLPAQLPRESTQFFGDQLFPYIKDIASNIAKIPIEDDDSISPVVKNAIIASNGKLTPNYQYIQEMRRKRAIEGAMSQTSTENHKVLVLGAGYVSYPVIDYITKHNDTAVTVVSSLKSEVDSLIGKYKRASPIILDVSSEQERLEELVRGHDLVISLLPYTLHPRIAKLCVENKKNLVTASYISEAMKNYHQKALDSGISIIMEVGLDPGIDHMLAMECFKDIKDRGGEITSFVSWCGGLPAPEAADNPLRYKFSWSPVGVLMVTLAPSKYIMNGQLVEKCEGGENYREGLLPISFMPGFNLEGLPNRDSTIYKKEYGLDQAHTILRGTLRYKGYRDAVVALQDLGLVSLDTSEILSKSSSPLTWKQFIAKQLNVNEDTPSENLKQLVYETVGQDLCKLEAVEGLGLLSDSVVETSTPNSMTALAKHLSQTLAYESDERDMIIMRHEVEASFPSGKKETHHIDLVEYGNPDQYTAMAKTVGYPCAIAARMLLLGKVQDKGIITPLKEHIYAPLLKELGRLGIKSKNKVFVKN